MIEVLTIQTYKSIHFSKNIFLAGVMLCGVEVKTEQMSLESIAEDAEWFRCPDIYRELVDHWGAKTEKSHNFAERALFALSEGGTSRPADVEEWSALTGACGVTSVWR